MPETFGPVTLQNDQGVKLNADYFNRLETNLETFDDRIAANELGVAAPITLSYAPSITIDASLGSLFRVTATGNVLMDVVNGQDGQSIEVQITAAIDFTLSFPGGVAIGIAAGGIYWARMSYDLAADEWLANELILSPSAIYPAAYPAAYPATY